MLQRTALLSLCLLISGTLSLDCLPNAPSCCDAHRFCRFWASKGECTVNPDWMLPNCQRSCHSCRMPAQAQVVQPQPQPQPQPQHQDSAIRRQPQHSSVPAGCPAVVTQEVDNRQILTPDDMAAAWRQTGCSITQPTPDCRANMCYHLKYRTFDGTCNNLQRPLDGAAYTPFNRLLPAEYDDGVQSGNLRGRPSARTLVTFLLSNRAVIPLPANSLLMAFGQYLSHDFTKNALTGQCPCGDESAACLNIPIPSTDPRSRITTCINMKRAIPMCASQLGSVRQQVNENTAFIDASTVYHSNRRTIEHARAGAFLKTSISEGMAFPPMMPAKNELDVGDNRNGIFTGLAMFHTTFVRLHNNIAAQLQNLNGHWNQDRIFQETRKIVGSLFQVITYREFLPVLLGPFFQRLVPAYQGYDASVNPSVLNEFATAAFRLHGLVQESYPLKNAAQQTIGNVPMKDTFEQVTRIVHGNFMDDLFRGLMSTPARSPQRLTTFMTEQFVDSDMGSINIQRGRDHGLRSYNEYRKICGLKALESFDEWPEVTDQAVRNRVKELYNGNVERIDLYVGGLVEEPVGSSLLGPTFSCIIAEQFTRFRDGDRFFYENPAIFTAQQRDALNAVTLSSILCSTSATAFGRVPRHAFSFDETFSNTVPCASLPGLDLEPWRE